MSDPVIWAKAFLVSNNAVTKKYGPWEARDYQAEMLRDRSLRKVYRCGRRCLPAWVRVMDPKTGDLVRVGRLFARKKANVPCMDEATGEITKREKCPVSYNGEKDIFNVVLSGGREIDATDNHPFYTPDGWKELKELNVGDYVAAPRILNYFGDKEIDDYEVKALAYIAGSNSIVGNTLKTSRQPGTVQFRAIEEVFRHFKCRIVDELGYDTYRVEDEEGLLKLLLKKYKYGFIWKEIPGVILKLSKRQVALFLSYMYAIGGYSVIHYPDGKRKRDVEITFTSSSDYLSHQIAHLLLRFGIDATVERSGGKWHVIIYKKEDIFLFSKEIGIFGEEHILNKCLLEAKNRPETNYEIPCRGDIMFKKIVRIENIGKHKTYDLHVPEYHNFIANDIVVHNTGKTEVMVVEGLWKALTKKKHRILYVTPYETQVNLIFMRIKELIHESPLVKEQVDRMINSPYMIEFKNGSAIMGFTTGASSGSGAASVIF